MCDGVASERITLRGKQLVDARNDYAWRMDPELAQLDGRELPRSTYEEFERSFRTELEFPTPGMLALSIEVDGDHVGNLVAYDMVAGESCEIGIVIGPLEWRHRGIGRQAITAFLQQAWSQLGLRKVYLHTLETNAPARASFESCGFRPVARVQRRDWMLRYEARREWWLMEHDQNPYPRTRRREQ